MEGYFIRWGQQDLEVRFPRKWQIQTLVAPPFQPGKKESEQVEDALDRPIGTHRLEELVRPGDRVAILVNDITRLWERPSFFLPFILNRLELAGVKDEDILILIATGGHRTNTPDELARIVGTDVYGRIKVVNHDCHDRSSLVKVRRNRRGQPYLLNRLAVKADRVIATGGITFHSLAGFSGGPKSVLPGVAGYDTIQQNHRLAIDDTCRIRPEITKGRVTGNPVAEDMATAARALGVDFMLNVIVGGDGRYLGVVAGDVLEAHARGCEFARSCFQAALEQPAPLVVASVGGFPRDLEMYQSIKSLDNAATVCEDRGTVVLASYCSDGVGSRGWLEWFNAGDRDAVMGRLLKGFTIEGFIALKTIELTTRYRVIFLSSLDKKLVRRFNMESVDSLDEALALADQDLPPDCRVVFMPWAGTTVPVLSAK